MGDYSDDPALDLIAEGEQDVKALEKPEFNNVTLDELELLKHPRVWSLADRFGIDGLKELACAKFRSQLQQLWTSDTLPDCIREVYRTTPENNNQLRGAVMGVVKEHYKDLYQKASFQEVYCEVNEFTKDLVKLLVELSQDPFSK